MKNAASIPDYKTGNPVDLNTLFRAMRGRYSSNPIDKVCAIAFPFQKRVSSNYSNITLPIYDPNTPVSVAWERLISSIASVKMGYSDLISETAFLRTPTIQLLYMFPHPSRHHWFPSWTQVQQYPDVSIRDNDPIPVAEDIDYSLRIVSGRIYHGCSLKLKRHHTSKVKAAYHCSIGMGSEIVELIATVPGVELDIDSRSTYVLVDICPDNSLWPNSGSHQLSMGRHIHPPIWQESAIIVCKEVDSLAQPVWITTSSPAIPRYHLRRITTLIWRCCLSNGPHFNRWLPFKPSLEHREFVVRRTNGPLTYVTFPDVFGDPAAAAGLPIKENGRHEWDKCPAYEVYLV